MAANKVIYLNDENRGNNEIKSNTDFESQFKSNTQFNINGDNLHDGVDYDVMDDGGMDDGGMDGGDGTLSGDGGDGTLSGDGGDGTLSGDGGDGALSGDCGDGALSGVGGGGALSGVGVDGARVLSGVGDNSEEDFNNNGYESDGGASIDTAAILEVDPMYIRLTRFLHTSEKNKNIADILLDISNSFTELNDILKGLSEKMLKASLQQ